MKTPTYTIKTCSNCQEEFLPTSKHRKCPKCRYLLAKTPCINCGKLCRKDSTYCVTCSNRLIRRANGKGKAGKFYYYLRKAIDRSSIRGISTDLDEAYLSELWIYQEGRCALTGIEIELSIYDWNNIKMSAKPWSASLDRIDSNKGYIKGNVQFVSLSINYGKSKFSQEDFIKNLDDIVESLSSNEYKRKSTYT